MHKTIASRDGGYHVELSPKEIDCREAECAVAAIEMKADEETLALKESKRQAALKKLEALGLACDEIEAAFGITVES